METMYQFMSYVFGDIMPEVFEIISDNWLLSLMFGLHIVYLVIIASKLKRNTD